MVRQLALGLDRLHAAGVPARDCDVDLPILSLWDERHYDRISVVDHFFEDAAAGTLPAFSMLDPGFLGPKRSDHHTYADVRIGQRFLREVFKAFSESKQWERGLFVLTYDEWGGFFDHVHPPIVPDDRTSPDRYRRAVPRSRPRRLTPRECARLMGFPDSFEIPVSDTQAYKQFGNSVVVPMMTAIAKAMEPHVLQRTSAVRRAS